MFFGGLGEREPGRSADHRARADRARRCSTTPRSGCGRSSRRATRVRPVRVARARAADARERPVVGARHAARRRQGRALRRTARRHGARPRSARARARQRVQPRRRRERPPDAARRSPTIPGRWDLSALRLLGSGGSILSGDVKDALMDAIPSVLAIVEGIGSSESPAQAVAVTTRGGAPSASLTFAPKAETMVVDDDPAPDRAGQRRGRPARHAGPRPARLLQGSRAKRPHVRRDRRRALVAAGRHGDDRRRRHDPPARAGARCASTPAARRCTRKRSRRC